MGSIITLSIVQSALELGFIYALVALALFISFSILNIADLSTDGCFTLGCAVCASVTLAGHPILGLFAAMAAGVCSGFVTAFLQTKMGIQSILAGIIVNTGLYTINIAVMGFASNMNLFNCESVFTWAKTAIGGTWYKLIVAALIVIIVGVLISFFLNTRLGLSIRATGDNPDMVRASSINTSAMITIGLCVANALTGLSGGLLAQYQKSCDINLGTGMVTIALASLIIGESIIGKGGMLQRVTGVILGSCLYRFIVAAPASGRRYRGSCPEIKCTGRVFKTCFCNHCSRGDRIPISEKADEFLPAETCRKGSEPDIRSGDYEK